MPELSQKFEQNIEQTLQLHLSPRLLAMLRVLQLSYADLACEIEKASEENPVLEVERPDVLAEYIRYLGSDKKIRKHLDQAEYPGMENIKDVTEDLNKHLIDQLQLENLDETSFKIAEKLIEHINASGYLKEYEKVKEEIVYELKVAESAVDKVLKVIQNFEPDGVGARDLAECLLIQVREYNFENIELEEVLKEVIIKHLEDLGQKNYKIIAEALDISEEGVIEIANFIKDNLNPNPGSSFGGEIRHVIPSFVMEKEGLINLEEKYGPRIKISSEYEKMLKNKKADAETIRFLKEKHEKAKELIENLKKRGETIERIMKVVMEHQKEFSEKGAAWLKPLLQKELAERLGLHPSTISRAIAEKYIQTPYGLFPIKFLCPRELSGFSSVRIKAMILDLVANEDKRRPLTDESLKELLGKEGVNIERRTIAGYRKEMGILSWGERTSG